MSEDGKIYVIRHGGVLYPLSPEDGEKISKPRDDLLCIEYVQKRNVKFHRKFFKLLQIVFDQQEKYSNKEDLRVEILLKSGQYTEHITTKGELIYIPKSMSFKSMKQAEFDEFYNKALDVCLKYFCNGTRQSLEDQVNNIMEFV